MAKEMVSGLTVKVPKGQSRLNERQVAAVELLVSNPPRGGLRRDKTCPVILFKSKAQRPVAVQRCESRKLRAHNRNQCVSASTKKFVARTASGGCPRGARPNRKSR